MTYLLSTVAIIGAGPSGTAAAICLANAGFAVTLLDKHSFPRDKVCGDALIPDALSALAELQLLERIKQEALEIPLVRIFAPNLDSIDLRGKLACMPRERLDSLLLERAISAGSTFIPDAEFRSVIDSDGRVIGLTVGRSSGNDHKIRAAHTILATGAAAEPLARAGVLLRKKPSGVALRAYFELPAALAEDIRYCAICFGKTMCPGYGWIFPGPGNIFNVGVGLFHASRPNRVPNLRDLWKTFLEDFEPAKRIKENARQLSIEKGAPLRTALKGARFSLPGLLVVGEAAGTTYSFSGEGIGKALQSGILAAKCIIEAQHGGDPPERTYQRSLLRQFKSRYIAYEKAQDWLSSPRVCNFIAAQANRGKYVKGQLEAFLAETANPSELFSWKGMVKALLMP